LAIEASKIIKKTIDVNFELRFDYPDMNKIMRLIKENDLNIVRQEMNMNCIIELAVRKKDEENILRKIKELRCAKIKMIN
jgi:putative IMPACT (imprinted ancient) family translation regulator